MPGIGKESTASDLTSPIGHDLKKDLLQDDDHQQEQQGPGGGEMHRGAMGGGYQLGNTVMGNEGPGNS